MLIKQPKPLSLAIHLVIMLVMTAISITSHASQLTVSVVDQWNDAVSNAVITLHSASDTIPAKTASLAVMDQVNKQFKPMVLPVKVGTAVRFPNNDNIRHHVYSFSPSKVFQLKLYSGEPSNPVIFNKPGVIVLGCNIHDSMIGYIYSTEAEIFDKTSISGSVVFNNLKPGQYELRVWHPYSSDIASHSIQTVNITTGTSTQAAIAIDIQPSNSKSEHMSPLELKQMQLRENRS